MWRMPEHIHDWPFIQLAESSCVPPTRSRTPHTLWVACARSSMPSQPRHRYPSLNLSAASAVSSISLQDSCRCPHRRSQSSGSVTTHDSHKPPAPHAHGLHPPPQHLIVCGSLTRRRRCTHITAKQHGSLSVSLSHLKQHPCSPTLWCATHLTESQPRN